MIPRLKPRVLRGRARNPVPVVAIGDDKGKFTVLPPPPGCYGAVNLPKRLFGVPLDDSKESLAIRAHEYSHLAVRRALGEYLMDTLTADLPMGILQAGLDNIVNGFARASGVDAVNALPMPRKPDKTSSIPDRAARLLQVLSVKQRSIDKGLTEADQEFVTEAAAKLRQFGHELARGGTDIGTARLTLLSLAKRFSAEAIGFRMELDEVIKERPDLGGVLSEIAAVEPGVTKIGTEGYCIAPSNPGWASMSIVQDVLDKKLNQKLLAPKRRPGFIGAFRNPLRALLPAFDGKAWSVKLRRETGSILIDVSGSMHLEPSQVGRLLENAPLSTVASYSSDGNRTGELHILAQNGRYTSDPQHAGSGNGVDGPALDWLTRQPAPRVWICDGFVSGVGDVTHPTLAQECMTTCVRSNIMRVESVEEYFELAEEGKITRRW